MDFKAKCMYCDRSDNLPNYYCPCNGEAWPQRYRTVDINIKNYEDSVRESFARYSFRNPAGMLQYQMLPYLNCTPDTIKTVGLTPLHKLNSFSSLKESNIYLKDEGSNPSGCFKDRETMMCILHSNHQNLDKTVIYSSGNAAASAATLIEHSSRQLITFVPGDTYPEKIGYIRNRGSDVMVIGDSQTTFEDGYRLFSTLNADKVFIENGFDNWSVRNPYRVQGDKTIALEIVKQLSKNGKTKVPGYVVVPTANGSCLAGIWKGFKELKEIGIISALPKMVSAGIKNASPVYKAVQEGKTEKPVQCDLSKVDPDDAEVGSIILAEEGYDSIEAAKAVLESNGIAVTLHASDIQRALINFLEQQTILATKHAILPEPASLTSLAALKKLDKQALKKGSNTFVCICTGHGLKAQNKISKLLADKPELKDSIKKIIAKRSKNISSTTARKGNKLSVEADIGSIKKSFFKLKKQLSNE